MTSAETIKHLRAEVAMQTLICFAGYPYFIHIDFTEMMNRIIVETSSAWRELAVTCR